MYILSVNYSKDGEKYSDYSKALMTNHLVLKLVFLIKTKKTK